MNNINFKLIAFIIFLLINFSQLTYGKIKSEIIYKINEEIITNIDIDNEIKFLLFLNPSLENLSKSKFETISKDSLKNRKIKEIELRKYYDLNENLNTEKYINNFISSKKYKNKDDLIYKLERASLQYYLFEKNLLIDNLWRQYIFERFNNKINIDINKLKKDIENQKNNIEELNLSEILFVPNSEANFETLKKQIYSEIEKSGFETAASIFSVSNSKNYGGKLGWVRSNQISPNIYLEIKNKEVSAPIKTNNGYLIIKKNESREVKEKINLEEELNKLINLETGKEINKLGFIYFNKLKKRIFISEN